MKPPTMWETWVLFLGWEDPLEKGMATRILQYSGLENPMGCIVHGIAESDISNFHFLKIQETKEQRMLVVCKGSHS